MRQKTLIALIFSSAIDTIPEHLEPPEGVLLREGRDPHEPRAPWTCPLGTKTLRQPRTGRWERAPENITFIWSVVTAKISHNKFSSYLEVKDRLLKSVEMTLSIVLRHHFLQLWQGPLCFSDLKKEKGLMTIKSITWLSCVRLGRVNTCQI